MWFLATRFEADSFIGYGTTQGHSIKFAKARGESPWVNEGPGQELPNHWWELEALDTHMAGD